MNNVAQLFLIILILVVFPIFSSAGDAVVAIVNGRDITATDLEAAIDQLIPQATYHGNISKEKRMEFQEQALNNLIDQELIYQDALSMGMKPDKKKVKAEMALIKARFKTKQEYEATLVRSRLTENELENRVGQGILTQNAIEKRVIEKSRVNEVELKEYYDKNLAKFMQPERIKLRIITTKDEEKAEAALAKIKAGEDFASVAEDMSEDQYRVLGGDIGYQHKGKLLPEVENAAFALKPGEVSGLIHAQGLWFITKVDDKKTEQQMTFDESKSKLKKELESKRAMELNEKWMKELKSKAKIEVKLKAN